MIPAVFNRVFSDRWDFLPSRLDQIRPDKLALYFSKDFCFTAYDIAYRGVVGKLGVVLALGGINMVPL